MRPRTSAASLPDDFDPRTICLSVDVEWAHGEVLDDIRALLDERGLRATFFATHGGILVPGHERGIHPNFRIGGDARRSMSPDDTASSRDAVMYEKVVRAAKEFAPEALGARGHSLHYDSLMLPAYRDAGIQYDSTYQIPMIEGLIPFWKEFDVVEIPIYFNDFFELRTGALGFDPCSLNLDAPGLKVMDFHPNTVYINASGLEHYELSRQHYHDPEKLLDLRYPGMGVRSLVTELLDQIAAGGYTTATLGDVNRAVRSCSSK